MLVLAIFLPLFFASHLVKPGPVLIFIVGSLVATLFLLMQIYLVPLVKNKIDENR